MEEIRVSVAIATYNGEKYIEEQIRSVLSNLKDKDEVVISDDGSKDGTLRVVSLISDPRIRVIKGPGLGVKKNFENAIRNCGGKYIFLCDQDDIWASDKVDRVLAIFEQRKCPVVVHDCSVIDEKGSVMTDSFFRLKRSGPGVFKNILKNTYIGCCMAFDKESLENTILPIPDTIVMHDQWIGVLADLKGGSVFIPDKLIKYRRHGNNTWEFNRHFGFFTMLTNRIVFVKELSKRRKELKRQTI